jgi:hypothetical protein
MDGQPSRRRGCVLALLVCAVLTLSWLAGPAPVASGSEDRVVLDRDFENPGPSLRPGFYWWWPGPAVEDAELRAEVEEMATAGFGHGQLFETPFIGLPPTGNPPETYMWGTRHWAERVRTAFQAARDNGFTVDLQSSSDWPWSSPAVTGENIELSAQQLTFGHQPLSGPSEHVGPPPPADDLEPHERRLAAVTAARRHPAGTDAEGQLLLDPDSTVDLTGSVDAQGNVRWRVPPGEWVLFGFWQGPAREGEAPSGGGGESTSGRLLDHLNRDAVKAATRFLDENLFSVLGPLARQSGGVFHNSSLEGFGARVFWTGDFPQEFRSRRGYHLTRYLPALTVRQPGLQAWFTGGEGIKDTIYDFPGSAGERVRRDYAQTLTELWVDEHVLPTAGWAHRHGLESAGRAIGGEVIGLNVLAVAKAYDVPDVDHVTNPSIDWVRTTTSGARLSGAEKASVELGDLINKDYMITLQTLKRLGDRQLAGGANVLDLHSYPYKFAHGADWPTWWAFSSEYSGLGLSEGFTPAIPLWRHLPRLADYFARAQTLLRAGRPVTDVAVYREAFGFADTIAERLPGFGDEEDVGDAFEPAVNSALTRSGFSFDIVDPDTVQDRSTEVSGGRLVVQRPGYKALVVDLDASKRIGLVDNTDAMAASVAWRLVRFARKGLPIVFVGRLPERGVSYRDPGDEDGSLQRAVAELKRSPRVRLAEDEYDVPAALADLGVDPDLAFDGTDRSAQPCGFGAQCVYSVHRRTNEGDYWYIWNAGDEPARFTGSFDADRRAPEVWDLWGGARRPLGLYRLARDGRVKVPLDLAPLESAVIGFERPARKHVVATGAEEVVVRDKELFLRSTEGGHARATLSNGRHVRVEFPRLPDPLEPGQWDLHVEGAVRDGEEAHDLVLTELADWREIPELAHTSGTGTYRATIGLSKSWTRDGRGAYLELGRVEGAVQVHVNGSLVHPAAVPPPRLDVRPFLRHGANRIRIELTTTLKNRLVEMSTHVDGYQRFQLRPETQPYGLIGPVRLTPYAERAVR